MQQAANIPAKFGRTTLNFERARQNSRPAIRKGLRLLAKTTLPHQGHPIASAGWPENVIAEARMTKFGVPITISMGTLKTLSRSFAGTGLDPEFRAERDAEKANQQAEWEAAWLLTVSGFGERAHDLPSEAEIAREIEGFPHRRPSRCVHPPHTGQGEDQGETQCALNPSHIQS